MAEKDRILVYSTDPKDQDLLSGKKKSDQLATEMKSLFELRQFTAVFRLEKQSRGGKTVTVIDKLPAYEFGVKELSKELKVKCGVGGSYILDIEAQTAIIEIQGDKRDSIKKIFDLKKIKYKGM